MLVASYAIAKITLYPILLLMFELGLSAKVAFGVIHGVIPIALFTTAAIRHIRPAFLKNGRTMGLGGWDMAWRILSPAAMPDIFAGLRVGFSLTLIGTLPGEMFASLRGIRFLLMNAIGRHKIDPILSLTFMPTVFAGAASIGQLALNRRLRWRYLRTAFRCRNTDTAMPSFALSASLSLAGVPGKGVGLSKRWTLLQTVEMNASALTQRSSH